LKGLRGDPGSPGRKGDVGDRAPRGVPGPKGSRGLPGDVNVIFSSNDSLKYAKMHVK